MAQIDVIVGFDVSKRQLDGYVPGLDLRLTGPNTPAGWAQLVDQLLELGVTTVVMEASGGYEQRFAQALRQAGLSVRIVDPKRVRYLARALGRLAKNDPIDAKTIAWFGGIVAAQPITDPDADHAELAKLVGARRDLVEMRDQMLNRVEHDLPAPAKQAIDSVVKAARRQIAKLEAAIAAMIVRCEAIATKARIIRSAPGIGPQGTAGLVAWLPELGQVSDEAIAALVGVAPYDDDSGKHHGQRRIAGGRRQLRDLLYMVTLAAATRHNPALKRFYKRLRAKGKPFKVALIACMRKLLCILNTMVARNQTWDPARHAETAVAVA